MADNENQNLLAVVATPKLYVCLSTAIYIFFPLCYIILVTLAGFLKSSIEEWSSFTKADVSVVTSLLISAGALGVICMIFAFCCKTINYMQFMSAFTPLLLILQIIAVVYGCIQAADNNHYLQKSINVDMKEEFLTYSSSDAVEYRFNAIQNEKDCCGVYSVNDYDALKISIPISCCSVSDNMNKYCDKKLAYQTGCASKLYQEIIKNIQILSYVTIGLIVMQIMFGGCIIKMLFQTRIPEE